MPYNSSEMEPRTVYFSIFIPVLLWILYKVTTFLLKFYNKRQLFNRALGPEDFHWFYGNSHLFIFKPSHERSKFFKECGIKFTRYFRIWVGFFRPVLILLHPDTVKILFKSSEPKITGFGGSYRFLLPWLGEGLLVSSGNRWSRSRRLLTPAFHFDILKPYIQVYNECSETMLNNIATYAESGASFELFQTVGSCSLDIILRCAFSYKTDCQKEGSIHPYVAAVRDITELITERGRTMLLWPDIVYYHTAKGRLFLKHCKYVHDVAEEVIEKRKEALEKDGQKSGKYLDFLDILLTARDENGEGLSDLEIRNEVDTFLFEGHDTTTSGISWILYSLAQHPEYQEKCQSEIDDLFENKETHKIEWEDLPKLEYLTMCIKEGMRCHSPVPGVGRQTTKEMTIDGTTYPPGTPVGVSINLLHTNPAVWKDPHTFDPQRFSKENITNIQPYSYCPFAAGSRNCIGQNFAMNEEKVVIANFLRRYTVRLDPDHKVLRNVAAVTRATNGIKVIVEKRQTVMS